MEQTDITYEHFDLKTTLQNQLNSCNKGYREV